MIEENHDYDAQRQLYLTVTLNAASKKYYNGEDSGLSDTDFDLYFHELQELEKKNGYAYPDSPTKRVGSDIQKEFKKGHHPSPMLTIDNSYQDDGLKEWVEKIHSTLLENFPLQSETYIVGTKFDGVSLEIKYSDGHLAQALTRGDKNIGDDVTENAKTIFDIPLFINHKGTLYVRGEVMLPKSRLNKINEEREKNGEEKFANSRNACSGSLKQLNPKITAQRGLIFRAWDCIGEPFGVFDMEGKLEFLKDLGFNTGEVPCRICLFKDVVKETNELKKLLDESHVDYDYDGVVVKVNETHFQEYFGTKDTRSIEWGIARKWNDKVVETVLLDVDWQVGRTGVLTPVARLEPVECGGVTVTNATLHNLGFIRKNDIMKYDWLKIVRSGDVIPYIEGVDLELREGGVRYPVETPVKCPICGGELEYEGELIKCINPTCEAKISRKIIQFCSKDCMDIKTIGESTVEDLVNANLISDYWDLYELRNIPMEELLSRLGAGYGELSINNMLSAIEDSKNRPFESVLASLSIPGVGKVTARLLAKVFQNIEVISGIEIDNLTHVNGIGDVMANDIYDWFHSDFGIHSVECMKKYGLNTSVLFEETEPAIRPLEGITVCFTGKSSRYSGDEVEKVLEAAGAKCTHSVSKSMDFLITGDKPGSSKVKKAEELGVKIISEKVFFDYFGI